MEKENEYTKIVKKSGGAKKTPGKSNKSGASKKESNSGESKKSTLKEGKPNNQSEKRLSGKIKIYDKETENDINSIELL